MNNTKKITIFTTDNPTNRSLFKDAVHVSDYQILEPLLKYYDCKEERFELWQKIGKEDRKIIVSNVLKDLNNYSDNLCGYLSNDNKELFDKYVPRYWDAISIELYPRLALTQEVFPWTLFKLKDRSVYALKYLSFPNGKKWIECLIDLAKRIAGEEKCELNLVLHDGDFGDFYTTYDIYGLDESDIQNMGFSPGDFKDINIISFKHTSNEIVKVLNEEAAIPEGGFYEKITEIIKKNRDKGIGDYIKKATFSISKTNEDPISTYWSDQS